MKRQHPFDLNLLAYLEALIDEQHVSRAAQRVNLSQPAMSLALKRLRTLFGDPLLVQTPKGMVPTPRAQELVGPVREILAQSRELVLQQKAFDPANSTDTFVITASNFVASVFLPNLIKRFEADAPHAELIVHTGLQYRVKEWFDDASVDIGVSYVVTPPGELHRRSLVKERLVCIARPAHPVIEGELTLDKLCAVSSVTVKPATRPFVGMLDRALTLQGRAMRVSLSVADFLLVPDVVSTSDLIAVVPERAAQRFLKEHALKVWPLPLELPPLELSMVWHERTHHELSRQWLRKVMRETFTAAID